MMEVGDGQQSQQGKDLVQVEVYNHLVSPILFPASANQVLPYSAASGLWCADGDSRALELGDGPQVPFNISIFLPNNNFRKMFHIQLGQGPGIREPH